MVKDVDEAGKGLVIGIADAVAGVLGEVHRQRAVGPEDPEEIAGEAWRPAVVARLVGGERRRREDQLGNLPEADHVVGKARRLAEPRTALVQRVETTQRLEEVELV